MIGRISNRWRDWVGASALRLARLPSDANPARSAPEAIFVLRNNDLGDVLVATPLLDALRRCFPSSRIAMGVGSWARPLLVGNPHLSWIETVDAPWFNKYASGGALAALRFAWASSTVKRIRERRFDIGIDVLGSSWGALLLTRARIPRRLGTTDFAGGEAGFTDGQPYLPLEHVARGAMRFAQLLGAAELPSIRPQVFLSEDEVAAAELTWHGASFADRRGAIRLLMAPGAGVPARAWPRDRFRELAGRLSGRKEVALMLIGGPKEAELCESVAGTRVLSLAGRQSLREMIATVASSDVVICNSSLVLHAAAAFSKPCLVLLGSGFPSASDHQRQWGYDGLSVSLGPERSLGQGIASVELAVIRSQELIERAAMDSRT